MSPETLPERPKLEKENVVFQTVTDTGIGAALGAGLGVLVNVLDMIVNKGSFSGKSVSIYAAYAAAGVALGAYIRGVTRNEERAKTKPYVERLEQELLAKNGAPDTLPPR